MIDGKKVALVLGGGGLRGLAHVGVLKELAHRGIVPDEYVGTSVGSFIAAMAAGGMTAAEIEEVARGVRREDILDYNFWGLLFKRGRAKSMYRGKALHDFIRRTLPVDDFSQLLSPLYIHSVNLDTGQETVWGMPGLTEVPIHDCVVASCAIPGIFPPKRINRFHFVDGSLTDSLPLKVAVYNGAGLIIAVFLDAFNGSNGEAKNGLGIPGVLTKAQVILSRTLLELNLNHFKNTPIVLVQPKVSGYGLFGFNDADRLIDAGREAAENVLDDMRV